MKSHSIHTEMGKKVRTEWLMAVIKKSIKKKTRSSLRNEGFILAPGLRYNPASWRGRAGGAGHMAGI